MNSAIEYVTVPFMGCDVLAVALDGIPVKNHLPAPLAAALKLRTNGATLASPRNPVQRNSICIRTVWRSERTHTFTRTM